MIYFSMELTDGTITLRPFILSDAKEHLAGEDDEQIKWLSGEKGSLEGVKDWIIKNQEEWEKDGHIFNFAIVESRSRKLLGMIEANSDFEELEGIEEGDANISYGLYPQARGKGYAFAAVNLIVDFLKKRGLKRAVIRINPDNKDSLRIPIKCGFYENGKIKTKNEEVLKLFTKQLNS